MNEKLTFEIRMRSITHLGRKLYDNLAAALAELVANSWDAYAKNVNIRINDDMIVIEDDGVGMNLTQLQSYYCPIGQEKEINDAPLIDNMKYRPVMGKKGIGKLAAFSLGNEYTVITKSREDQTIRSFTLEYDSMKNYDGDMQVDVEDVTDNTNYPLVNNNGFCVEIKKLRKQIDGRTKAALITRLSRRFSILSDTYDFTVKIDGEIVKFDDNYLKDKIQYIWVFAKK